MRTFGKTCILSCFLAMGLASLAHADIKCFTWSNQILFMASGTDEVRTGEAVVKGCMKNPYTSRKECREHLRCIPDGASDTFSSESSWIDIEIVN